jgi:hypothetical protein
MKNIIIILTTILLSTNIANTKEKKNLADVMPKNDCIAEHKISPNALGCGIKKLFKKKDGTPNAMGKFFNAKSFADLKNKEILETPDYKPKVGILDKLKEKIGKIRKK